MPYSQYVMKDRQAIGQIRYQVRRFVKQMKAAGVAQEDIDRIADAFQYALAISSESHDFDDDGSRIYYGETQS